MIIVVAPYSPPTNEKLVHLGGSSKIEIFVQLMSDIDPEIILVNSAHNQTQRNPLIKDEPIMVGNVAVRQITPPTFPIRKVGKLFNLFDTRAVAKYIMSQGAPALVWAYNGYAFESMLILHLRRKTPCPFVLELEDWHFSRVSFLNPKPLIDYIAWKAAVKKYDYFFAVNMHLAVLLRRYSSKIKLLPGLVATDTLEMADVRAPFSNPDLITIGYFGGLTREKGAHLILEAVQLLPNGFRFEVTGSGELGDQFESACKNYPHQLNFHGSVDRHTLAKVMQSCDVIVNPHSPIDEMRNGIFPFKVVEGIATGRLMVSTSVPSCGIQGLLSGVRFIGFDSRALASAVVGSRDFYRTNMSTIRASAHIAREHFGSANIAEIIRGIYNVHLIA